MEEFTTLGLPSAGRAAAWGEIYARSMSQVEFVPGDKDKFGAALRINQYGPVKLARLAVEPCSVERKQSHIERAAPRHYNFLLQAEGASTFCHCGKESELQAGDFVLCDTGLPHYWLTGAQSVTMMVRVAPAVLRTYLPTPEQFCGQHLGRAFGLKDTIATMVRELSEKPAGAIEPAYEDRVARYLLEMISMYYIMGSEAPSDASAIAWQRRKDVIQYIEENLRDPDLSPTSISEGLRVSPRYIRTVFSTGGEKISTFILRRRLEECARQIRSPAWAAHTLTEIAFSWGFNSAAHFTRTFHEKYGVAPRDYRRVAIGN